MEIVVKSKRAKKAIADLEAAGWLVVDVTSSSPDPEYRKFSPFYPHGNIKVDGNTSESVEGLWQGLKVFEGTGVDNTKFGVKNMKNLKRTCRKYGKVLGHQFQGQVIDYVTARKKIFIPTYQQLLNTMEGTVHNLAEVSKTHNIVLLDYDTNESVEDTSKPLSHASLIKKAIIG